MAECEVNHNWRRCWRSSCDIAKECAEKLPKKPRERSSAQILVDAQAEDAGLWFEARTAPEAYLQAALRKLHAAVETPNVALSEAQDEQ